jgi:hypothetical protein
LKPCERRARRRNRRVGGFGGALPVHPTSQDRGNERRRHDRVETPSRGAPGPSPARRGQAESSRQDLADKLQQEERKSPLIMNKVSPQRSGNVNARVEYSRARRKARIDSTNGVNIDVRPFARLNSRLERSAGKGARVRRSDGCGFLIYSSA